MKILLITHKDLDGVSCAVLGYYAYKNDIEVYYETPYTIDARIEELIASGEYKKYDKIFITDLSVKQYTAIMLNKLTDINLVILDHHKTALNINKYPWVIINTKECGTSLYYDFLIKAKLINPDYNLLQNFVNIVKDYDTWKWQEKHDVIPFRLNLLLNERGISSFIDDILIKLDNRLEIINSCDKVIIDKEEGKIYRYIDDKIANTVIQDCTINGKSYKIGFVIADSHISILGNKICESYPIDFAAILQNGKISFRTIKDDIKLDEISKYLGGGGHGKSAGAPIIQNLMLDIMKIIFQI